MKQIRNYGYVLAISVALVTFAVYLPALQNDFVNWDDNEYVYDNPHIRSLDYSLLEWAFTGFHAANWHPLTWISHAMDFAVWGGNPKGHHLSSVILHALNTFLVVMLVAGIMPGAEGVGAIGWLPPKASLLAAVTTGVLFGLHPIHVESVAWVSERKDLLCGFFFLLSLISYTAFAGKADAETAQSSLTSRFIHRNYLLSLVFFAMALMGKPMAVSLPLVLLILDWYPFGRTASATKIYVEKIPFIALSIISSVLTIAAQSSEGAMTLMNTVPSSTRLFLAIQSLAMYLWKMIVPLHLTPLYPYPAAVNYWEARQQLPFASALVLAVLCVIAARKHRVFLAGWAYYVATLLPVLGIIQVGGQSMADRYTYLPSLGPFLLIGTGVGWSAARIDALKRHRTIALRAGGVAAIVVVVAFAYITVGQIGVWRNSIALWDFVIMKDPEIPLAYYNRGLAFEKNLQREKAIDDHSRAVALDPAYSEAYVARGLLYKYFGRFADAIADFDNAAALAPFNAAIYNNRGLTFYGMGHLDKAVADFSIAISLNQGDSGSYVNRGLAYLQGGRNDLAVLDFRRACELGNNFGCTAQLSMSARP